MSVLITQGNRALFEPYDLQLKAGSNDTQLLAILPDKILEDKSAPISLNIVVLRSFESNK